MASVFAAGVNVLAGASKPDAVPESRGIVDTAEHRAAATTSGAVAKEEHYRIIEDADEGAMIREPTELDIPLKDILCTFVDDSGEQTNPKKGNERMQGLFAKCSRSFGGALYRLIRPDILDDEGQPSERFLFQTEMRREWIIGPIPPPAGNKYNSDKVGCAVVEVEAEATGEAALMPPNGLHRDGKKERHAWTVWQPNTKRMEKYSDAEAHRLQELGKVTSIPDLLTVRPVIGFEVIDGSFEIQALFLRLDAELYGRPVYEGEMGGQYLYWLEAPRTGLDGGGTLELGMKFAIGMPGENGREEQMKEFMKNEGHWIIAKDIGLPPEAEGCLAYIKDKAHTPHGIDESSHWYVAVETPGGGTEFEENDQMVLACSEVEQQGAGGFGIGDFEKEEKEEESEASDDDEQKALIR